MVARFEVMALFAGALHGWLFLVIGVHVLLVFLFQTLATTKKGMKRVFIYLFTGFIFIFAYLEFNMKSRIKVSGSGRGWKMDRHLEMHRFMNRQKDTDKYRRVIV